MNYRPIFACIVSEWHKEHLLFGLLLFASNFDIKICHIFDKMDSFQKNIFECFWNKKEANCIFEELSNLYLIIFLISFFPFPWWIAAAEKRASWRNYLFEVQSQAKQQKHTNCTWLIISNCNNASKILDWTHFLHHLWLQEFIQQQT